MSFKAKKGLQVVPVRYRTVGGDMYDAKHKGTNLQFEPQFYVEDNMMQYEYVPLSTNQSNPEPLLRIGFSPLGLTQYQVLKTLEQSSAMYKHIGASDSDLDEIKYMMTSGLWRMAVVQVIGMTQLVLNGLAFKNDISFFQGREDFTGLSSRSLVTEFGISLIIFLYLYDNEFTSRLVLYPMGFGLVVNVWKLKRRLHLRLFWQYLLPWVGGKSDFSAEEKVTEDIDARGMKYIAVVLYPMVVCLAVYSLMNHSYKSWWSWLISSLADASYTFGFINNNLKSVAHMPWRVMMYKAFNTFVDDAVAWG